MDTVLESPGAASGDTPPRPRPRSLADVFDNEALWGADDDTDDYILALVGELESSLALAAIDMTDSGGNSLLHMAAIWNRPKIMEVLIRRGAELNDKNVSGHTPLDLATHYGNVDLALQLRHYGAKHTCESERDLAIAQRDLSQQQLRDIDSDFQDALQRLQHAKQEREELRVERDRLQVENGALVVARDALASETTRLDQAVVALTTENQQSLLRLAQLQEAFTCECDARLNAVQSWHTAQQVIAELQARELAYREREEEAIRMRNEALKDRDVAREIARLAQLDQGLAKQAQLDAECERDSAVGRQLDAEQLIATEKELWTRRIAKTERDRKNIQIEIDRQTATLRKECDRLEKQLRTAGSLTWSLREELAAKVALSDRLDTQVLYLNGQLRLLEQTKQHLEQQVEVLEVAQRNQHKEWRDALEKTMRESAAHDMRRILVEVIATAEKLVTQQHALQTLGLKTRRDLVMQPELTTSLFTDASCSPRPSSAASSTRRQVTVLPFLPDRCHSGGGSSLTTSTPILPSPSLSLLAPEVECHGQDPESEREPTEGDEFHLGLTIDLSAMASVASTARAAMRLDTEKLDSSSVADLVVTLAVATREFLDAVTGFVSQHWRHFRKQVQALEKMVERKDELIARFNQHRRDKPKKQSARLRECIYKPPI